MPRKLIILGAGQYGMVAKEIAEAMGCFTKIDFLDDGSERAIGTFSDYKTYSEEYSDAFVAIGNPELRIKWIRKLEEASYSIPVLVHPQAYVSASARVQKGCVIEPNAVVHTGASLAAGVIVSAGAVVNHNSSVGDVCHIDCGAVVAARVAVPSGTKVESLCLYK